MVKKKTRTKKHPDKCRAEYCVLESYRKKTRTWLKVKAAQKPGLFWRAQSHPDGCFDELVIDSWFHLEQLDKRTWYLGIGDHTLYITVNKDGSVHLNQIE